MIIKITAPYMPGLSKNRKFVGRCAKVLSPEYKRAKSVIYSLVKSALNKSTSSYSKQKVWIGIMIYRPSMRGDPSNNIEGICDSIKLAIGIDDNYFSCVCDWEVDKLNPRLVISIIQ